MKSKGKKQGWETNGKAKSDGEKVKSKRRGSKSKLDTRMLLKIYDLAKQGLTDNSIARGIGMQFSYFTIWKRKHVKLRIVLKCGRKFSKDKGGFLRYVFNRLSPEMKEVWKELVKLNEKNASAQIEALLEENGEVFRQHMFIHSLVQSNWNVSAACRFVNINQKVLLRWKMQGDFGQMMDELMWHRANLVESSLMDLVVSGDKTAIIFANKTLNSDRGYGMKLSVKHEGKVDHQHVHGHMMLDQSTLDMLSHKCKTELLRVMEAKEKGEVLNLENRSKGGEFDSEGEYVDADFEIADQAIEDSEEEIPVYKDLHIGKLDLGEDEEVEVSESEEEEDDGLEVDLELEE